MADYSAVLVWLQWVLEFDGYSYLFRIFWLLKNDNLSGEEEIY